MICQNIFSRSLAYSFKPYKRLGAEIINFDDEDPVDVIKKETKGKGIKCIIALGFEEVGHFAGNGTIGGSIDNGNGGSANGGS
jgi:hypothetical protein